MAIAGDGKEPARSALARLDLVPAASEQPYSTAGPLISIVILTRDGADHLRRLFPALEVTAYRSFEVVVVDNGSSDDTRQVLEADWGFELTYIRNEDNASFSDGNNRGVAESRGEFVLLLNNDVEPVTDRWLGAMLAEFNREPEPAAVGALLLYPEMGDPSRDLTIQHKGIVFDLQRGAPTARNWRGGNVTGEDLSAGWEVPGVTGAALLVRKEVYLAVGGCDPAYFYGLEDVDLCLKLRRAGAIVVAVQAVLFHHEGATVRQLDEGARRAKRERNRRHFVETWAPCLVRSLRRDTLAGRGFWTGNRERTVAITLTSDSEADGRGDYYTAHGLGTALAAAGWSVVYAERAERRWYHMPRGVDLVISLLDAYDVRRAPKNAFTIAWVRNWIDRWLDRPWFDDFDLVVASSEKAADRIGEATGRRPPVLPLAVDPEIFHPGPASSPFAADFAFTGSHWGTERRVLSLLDVRPGERFLLVGKNWDRVSRAGRYWRGHLPQSLLAELYRSVKVVLDDTVYPLDQALVNARVFEALASSALVLSDNVEGARELFSGLLPTYRDAPQLRRLLDRFLADDDERTRLAGQLRDMVLAQHTYRHRAHEFCSLALSEADRPRLAVKTAVSTDPGSQWGDCHFARSLSRALNSVGFASGVHTVLDGEQLHNQHADVVVHLRGREPHVPKPAQVNVLWIISHPDAVSARECALYDLVLCASRAKTDLLRKEGIRVAFLPQATDGRRFGRAHPDEQLKTEVLFVGNSRGELRPAVHWALEQGLSLTVYGSGWKGLLPPDVLAGADFPNRDLGNLYASAEVVLCDHWPDMVATGLVSNRVFDILASGGVLVSDGNPGIDELLPGAVPIFSSAGELADVVRRVRGHREAYAEQSRRGRRLVLTQHTFEQRAATIASLVWELLDGRPSDCDGGVFTHPDRPRSPGAHNGEI